MRKFLDFHKKTTLPKARICNRKANKLIAKLLIINVKNYSKKKKTFITFIKLFGSSSSVSFSGTCHLFKQAETDDCFFAISN